MPRPTLLITRPEADARAFAEEAEALGFSPVFEPLLEIAPLPAPPLPDAPPQALVFTSTNGVRAFVQAYPLPPCPAYAVGDATARAAKAAGFDAVRSAGGDVHALERLVLAELEPSAGPLIHSAGQSVAGDLQGALTKAGFRVVRLPLYQSSKAQALSRSLIMRFENDEIDNAAFFSPRTATAFVRLAKLAGIDDKVRSAAATALSANVSAELCALPWRSIDIASEPTQKALLTKLLQVQQEMASGVRD